MSSCFPLGNVCISFIKSSSHCAFSGIKTRPPSINGVTALTLLTLSDDTFYGFRCDSGVGTPTSDWNFGNGFFGNTAIASAGTNASNLGLFEYDVPADYKAICSKGLNT